ncbi:energy transducer TonB [Colwelliaceae bacterium 6441]
MENKLIKFTLLPFILSALSSSVYAIEVAKHLSTVVNPVPIKRVHPEYPIDAARSNREGWSKLSFVIEKDGSVSNVLVTETSGSKDFDKAAKRAVLKWKYQPALEDGKPIQQCANSVQMDFRLHENDAGSVVRRKFRSNYSLAVEALKNKDLQLMKGYLDEMSEMKYRYLSENNYLHTLLSEYARESGDNAKQLYHLERISLNTLSVDRKMSILNSRFLLSVNLNQFHNAYHVYTQLAEIEEAKSDMKKYDDIITKVDNLIGSAEDFIVSANIEDNEFWQYSLVRNEFSLTDIDGTLNKLDIRCANKRHVYTVENNNTWKLPKSWENCSLFIYGSDNTRFKLIEHAMKS